MFAPLAAAMFMAFTMFSAVYSQCVCVKLRLPLSVTASMPL